MRAITSALDDIFYVRYAEELFGKPTAPNENHTDAAELMWKKRQRSKNAIATTDSGSFTFNYLHNPNSSTQHGNFGNQYGQQLEPAGRYLVQQSGDHVPEGWESGQITFNKPLHLPFGGGYQEESNWKNQLSKQHGGKAGRGLSHVLRTKGYDGIVTHDEDGTREIVDLNPGRRS